MAPALISDEVPAVSQWKRPEKTTHQLPWADIKVIDLGKFASPGGKKELAEDLREAVSQRRRGVVPTPLPVLTNLFLRYTRPVSSA